MIIRALEPSSSNIIWKKGLEEKWFGFTATADSSAPQKMRHSGAKSWLSDHQESWVYDTVYGSDYVIIDVMLECRLSGAETLVNVNQVRINSRTDMIQRGKNRCIHFRRDAGMIHNGPKIMGLFSIGFQWGSGPKYFGPPCISWSLPESP